MDEDSTPTTAPDASYFLQRTIRRAKHAGGKAERHFRRTKVDAKIGKKPPKTRSEKSRAAWRSNAKRDEKIFSNINKKLRSRQPVRLTEKSAHTVWASGKSLADAERAGVRIIPDIGLPHWDHASALLKMLGWAMASREMRAVPFTLRLAAVVIEAARADPRGAGRCLQDRLSRHLRYRFPDTAPAFWFAVEQGIWEEPHLHGAVVIPDGGRDQVKAALRAAGGEWRSTARQLWFSPVGNLVTWVGYATKWLFGSMVKFGDDNLVGATQNVRREAKRLYQDARKANSVLYP